MDELADSQAMDLKRLCPPEKPYEAAQKYGRKRQQRQTGQPATSPGKRNRGDEADFA